MRTGMSTHMKGSLMSIRQSFTFGLNNGSVPVKGSLKQSVIKHGSIAVNKLSQAKRSVLESQFYRPKVNTDIAYIGPGAGVTVCCVVTFSHRPEGTDIHLQMLLKQHSAQLAGMMVIIDGGTDDSRSELLNSIYHLMNWRTGDIRIMYLQLKCPQ
jgi:hypothetical protein